MADAPHSAAPDFAASDSALPPASRERQRAAAWMIPLLLFVFWLGARDLNTNPIWDDERYTYRDVGALFYGPLTPVDIWNKVAADNPWHTPGYFILLSGWGQFTGWTIFAVRSLSLFLGVLAVAWTYRLGADQISRRAGLYAAAILGTSMLFVFYLANARVYALATLLTVVVVTLYLRVVTRRGPLPAAYWLALFLSAVGLFYTHYLAIFGLVAIGAYHLLWVRKDARWWRVTATLVGAGLLFLPWVGVMLAGVQQVSGNEDLRQRAGHALDVLALLASLFGNGWLILLPGAVLLALALRRTLPLNQRRGADRLLILTAVLLALFLVSNEFLQYIHLIRSRYLLGLWPLLALVAGVGLWLADRRFRVPVGLAVVVLWLALGVVQTVDRAMSVALDNFRFTFPLHIVADRLAPLAQREDLLVNYLPDGLGGKMYSDIDFIADLQFHDFPADTLLTTTAFRPGSEALEREDRQWRSEGRPRIWLASMPDEPAAGVDEYRQSLAGSFAQCPVQNYTRLRIEQYVPSPVCCLSERIAETTLMRFGDGIRLTATEDATGPLTGDALPVSALWALDDSVPPNIYSVTLQLFDGAGNKVAQGDYGLTPLAYTCEQAELPVGDLAPGDYTLRIGVYMWETGERLPGTVTATGEQGELLPLRTVTIADA